MDQSNLQDVLNAGAAVGGVRAASAGAAPFSVVPEGYALKDLESSLPSPLRKRAAVKMIDSPSFIAYVKEQSAACKLYADVDYDKSLCTVVAVLNDHSSTAPDWRDHRATYQPKLSIEWMRWTDGDKKQSVQSTFGEFLEENMADIVGGDGFPSGSDMLQMALNFEAVSEKRFKKMVDLGTGGVALEYVDKADDATSLKINMFRRFKVGIPVFQGDDHGYAIEARLKFRQTGDTLMFWYELIRKDRIFREAVTAQLSSIKDETSKPLLYGTP